MEELVEKLVRWKVHPEILVTHTFTLGEISSAYELMATGKYDKVAVIFE